MAIDARKKIITLGILLLVVSPFFPLARADQTAAAAAIASAKEQIATCYSAAKEAESAGANITALTAILNDAGELISRAEYTYSIGDFDAAQDLAVQSQRLLSDFVAEANALKETAAEQRNRDFMINIVGSSAGTFAVLGVGSAIWVLLRRRERAAEAQANKA
ncbi:MAG: hypothetical protein NWF09_01505 [Candidatus Bathyarchaeota archaeon]|nr:hypothetical protein [Candidatus Bathyarchaeota archaeon]